MVVNQIIIQNSQIAVRAARASVQTQQTQKIVAVSQGATDLVRQIQLINGNSSFSDEDARPISDLQHYLMDNMKTLKGATLNAKIKEMFDLMGELEEKFKGEIEVM